MQADQYSSAFEEISGELMEILERDEKKSSGYQIYVKAALLKILAAAADAGLLKSSQAGDRPDREKLEIQRRILRFLDLHYSEHLNLKDIAAYFNMSPKHFCRYLGSSFGRTLFEYLHHFRIKRACSLLLGTDMRIMDIAFAVCFESFQLLYPQIQGVYRHDAV